MLVSVVALLHRIQEALLYLMLSQSPYGGRHFEVIKHITFQ